MQSILRKILYNINFNTDIIVSYFLNIKMHSDDFREEILV